MDLGPNRNQDVIEPLKDMSPAVLQEPDVKQRLVVVDVPMRMAHFECEQHVRVSKHGISVHCHDRLGRIMPLSVNYADLAMVPSNFCGGQQINVLWGTRVLEPMIGCRAANDEPLHELIVSLGDQLFMLRLGLGSSSKQILSGLIQKLKVFPSRSMITWIMPRRSGSKNGLTMTSPFRTPAR